LSLETDHSMNRLSRRCFSTTIQSFHIPVIDFKTFRRPSSPYEKKETADSLVSAFKESGFTYLTGHGIPEATLKHVFGKCSGFFRLPSDTKANLLLTSTPRG